MGKIVLDEDEFEEGMQEVIGRIFYNDHGELAPPFEHLAEYFVIELSEELMDDIKGKVKEIGEIEEVPKEDEFKWPNEDEYQCAKCHRWFTDEDIGQFRPCLCKVCLQNEVKDA